MCTHVIAVAVRTYLHNRVVYAEISVWRAQIAIYFYTKKKKKIGATDETKTQNTKRGSSA